MNTAAVYSSDRSVLKSFVTAPRSGRISIPEKVEGAPIATPAETHPGKLIAQETLITKPYQELERTDLTGDDLINELFSDLEKLKKLRHDFEIAADGFELPPPTANKTKNKDKPIQSIVSGSGKPTPKETDPDEGMIAEIKSTKKKIKPSDPKQKEQLDIIDQFIKSKPNIPRNKIGQQLTPTDTDLSESSSVFSENVVSETLVEILIKQGKKEKAVEVLKKLIWKFPQKKAYFAAQIEELTA